MLMSLSLGAPPSRDSIYLAAGAARPAAVSYARILGATALPFFRAAQVIVPFFGGGAKGPFWASLAALPPRSVPPAAARHDPNNTLVATKALCDTS